MANRRASGSISHARPAGMSACISASCGWTTAGIDIVARTSFCNVHRTSVKSERMANRQAGMAYRVHKILVDLTVRQLYIFVGQMIWRRRRPDRRALTGGHFCSQLPFAIPSSAVALGGYKEGKASIVMLVHGMVGVQNVDISSWTGAYMKRKATWKYVDIYDIARCTWRVRTCARVEMSGMEGGRTTIDDIFLRLWKLLRLHLFIFLHLESFLYIFYLIFCRYRRSSSVHLRTSSYMGGRAWAWSGRAKAGRRRLILHQIAILSLFCIADFYLVVDLFVSCSAYMLWSIFLSIVHVKYMRRKMNEMRIMAFCMAYNLMAYTYMPAIHEHFYILHFYIYMLVGIFPFCGWSFAAILYLVSYVCYLMLYGSTGHFSHVQRWYIFFFCYLITILITSDQSVQCIVSTGRTGGRHDMTMLPSLLVSFSLLSISFYFYFYFYFSQWTSTIFITSPLLLSPAACCLPAIRKHSDRKRTRHLFPSIFLYMCDLPAACCSQYMPAVPDKSQRATRVQRAEAERWPDVVQHRRTWHGGYMASASCMFCSAVDLLMYKTNKHVHILFASFTWRTSDLSYPPVEEEVGRRGDAILMPIFYVYIFCCYTFYIFSILFVLFFVLSLYIF